MCMLLVLEGLKGKLTHFTTLTRSKHKDCFFLNSLHIGRLIYQSCIGAWGSFIGNAATRAAGTSAVYCEMGLRTHWHQWQHRGGWRWIWVPAESPSDFTGKTFHDHGRLWTFSCLCDVFTSTDTQWVVGDSSELLAWRSPKTHLFCTWV